jgi:hypothetical protein
MTTAADRRRHASQGAVAARIAVAVGLAAAVGLLWAGDGSGAEHVASSAMCASPANGPFAAS